MTLDEYQKSLEGHIDRVDLFSLLSHVLGKTTAQLLAYPDYQISQRELKVLSRLVQRRIEGEPIAYLTGVKEFWSVPLQVNPAVLIPRPETEILVETILELYNEHPITVLDCGTGSGAIALALAKERAEWSIFALDKSNEALEVAKANAHALNLKVTFFHSDWFSHCSSQRFQIIASNPPYIGAQEWDEVSAHLSYEPRNALLSAEKGLGDLEILIHSAPQYLNPQGLLILEHGATQAKAVRSLMKDQGYYSIHTVKDLAGLDRVSYGYFP